MKNKNTDKLKEYYNAKYCLELEQAKRIIPIVVNKYPRDRYEAVIFWGKGSGRALEIGAGSGEVAVSLSRYYEQYIVTELSIGRVDHLRRLFGQKQNIKVIENDIEETQLGYPCEYFDTIIMNSVIEHLIEPISVVKYCYALLKHGGRMLIYTPNIAKWTRRLKLLFGFFPSTGSRDEGFICYDGKPLNLHDDGHLHYFTFRSIRKLMIERTGFSEVRYCGHGKTFLSKLFPCLFSECCVIGVK